MVDTMDFGEVMVLWWLNAWACSRVCERKNE